MKGFYVALGAVILVPILLFFSMGKELFSTISEFVSSMYGKDLALHLYGWNGVNFEDNSNYVPNGFFLYYFTLFAVVLFYYLIDSPSFSRMVELGDSMVCECLAGVFRILLFLCLPGLPGRGDRQ